MKRSTVYILNKNTLPKAWFVLCAFFVFLVNSSLFAGNSDLVISNAAANGAWTYSAGVYTWTPNANSSTVISTDIVACLLGSNTALGGSSALNSSTNGAGSVTLLTASVGNQTGNVTMSQSITAATTSATQRTFTITAAGSITISQGITLTPASNASTGYPGTNIVFSGATGVTNSQPIITTGGSSTGNAVGGLAGAITLTSSGGAISTSHNITAQGAAGGSSNGASSSGGAGGAITFSGTSISTATGDLVSTGGASAGGPVGGAGGNISLTATSTTITSTRSCNTTGGVGSSGNGGAGGSITFLAATDINYSSVSSNSGGGAGSGTGNGGTGGAISFTATAGSVSVTHTLTSTGGASGVTAGNRSGGAGGAISLIAATTLSITQPITADGGTCLGTSTANGGAISFTGPTGVKTQHTVFCAAGTGGGTGTGGVIAVNDGNASITSGGANDGQTNVASYTGGSFVKLGTGNFNLGRAGNTWTGSTTLTAGTLTLGVSNTLDNSTQIVFNGGSLSAPYDETVGTMKVDKYSVLYLSTGNHTLTFAASAGITWSGGNLSVRDWLGGYDGTLAGGSDPKLKIGTGNNVAVDLTAAQLAKVFFHRTSNSTNYTSTQTIAAVTGEVVPTATLPVELLSFSAEKDASSTIISWSTASEINSDYFEVRRAGSDMRWESIAKMKAAGNSAKI